MLAALLYLTKMRLAFTTLAAIGWFILAPRWDCSWQVERLRFQSLRVGLWTLDLEMDVGLRVWNPNHVPAKLLNASLALFRVQPQQAQTPPSTSSIFLFPAASAAAAPTPLPQQQQPTVKQHQPLLPPARGPAFGTATLRRPHRVPRRDTFFIEAVHVSLVQMPLTTALTFLWEMLTGFGSVRVRAIGSARVRAAKQEVTVWVDCLQRVQVLFHPVPQITESVCSYALEKGSMGMGVGSLLEEALSSMDFTLESPLPREAAVLPVGGGGVMMQ